MVFRDLCIFKYSDKMKIFNLGFHPVNLLFRFLLELAVLAVAVLWAWISYEGWVGFVLAFVLPFLLAVIWGSFTVPGDPSRSGKSPVPISGTLRLLLELLIFSFPIWCLFDMHRSRFALVLGLLVLLHYLLSLDRIRWLIKKSPAL